jgi:hypothetical protein
MTVDDVEYPRRVLAFCGTSFVPASEARISDLPSR